MSEQKRKQKTWSLRYPAGNAAAEEAVCRLAEETGFSEVMARLLYTRGYQNAEAVRVFLHQEETQLHDPYGMQDMERAVERIRLALEKGEKIAIYGDYDVDGVTSVSLLYLYLTSKGGDVGYYIPSRIREGYGLSEASIDRLSERGVELMITVDTGITANDEIEYAKSLGIDTVVTDHHECRADLPNACAVVNPHRPDDTYPFTELAGVGVIFKVICAIEIAECRAQGRSELDGIREVCKTYADLVAIGTIADVMPIVDENRLIVKLGLQILEDTKRLGLRALFDAVSEKSASPRGGKKRKINSGFIGYVIAPRINAAGRVSNASIAVELLLAEDAESARNYAEQLCELNLTRQVEENRIAEQAYKKIEKDFDPARDRVIVIDDDTWQQGIIGIVSSRITERYGLPSILISFDGATRGYPAPDDIGKGSGRSIKGMNLVEALTACEDSLVRFGGHELAAGLTVRRCMIEEFRNRINQYANEHLGEESFCASLDADCEVEARDLHMNLATELSRMEPFGVSNPVPNLVLREATVLRALPMGGGKHTKLTVEKDGIELNAVWFNVNAAKLELEPMDKIDILFQLNVNEFRGVTSVQLLVQDIHPSEAFELQYQLEKKRYEEIRQGGELSAEEDLVPTRDDMVQVYTLLRREFRNGKSVFPIRRILMLLHSHGVEGIGYVKLKFIIRIMQELQICGVTEPAEDRYVFEFYFHTSKTNLEKSSILHKLKSQIKKGSPRV